VSLRQACLPGGERLLEVGGPEGASAVTAAIFPGISATTSGGGEERPSAEQGFLPASLVVVPMPAMIPQVAVIVIPMVPAMIIGLALIVVAMIGIPGANGNGDLGLRFCRNQSQEPEGGEEH
jgi:hypothetical protein